MHIVDKKSYRIDEQMLNPLLSTLPSPLLTHGEMMSAIDLMIHRMDAIDSSCTDAFPLYSPGTTDRWVTSSGGSWVGGFWSGCWWLRSRITGSASDQCKASDICQRLSQKVSSDSINRSLIFWYGAAPGDLWFGDVNARELAEKSVTAIAASYDPETNCIPLGTDMGGGKEGNQFITIDTLASLIQLLNRSKHVVYHQISRCHADTIIAACRADNGAFHATAHFEQGAFRPIDQAGIWSRGQAWAMLGLSQAAAQWGEPYLAYARSACEYWKYSRPGSLPLNRLDDPSGLSDLSSAAIASLAFLSLADLVPDGTQWRIYAHQQVTAIVRSQYFTGFPENSDDKKSRDGTASGIFWGCHYKTSHDKDELVESVWGSFFLMAALCVLIGAIKPGDF
ncbi:glucuronyl hydrolase [Nitrosovibrio sp. Nv4]|uniref:glucuronyl hydrolase n=1 Tax=Nitrosovibrio sp. Nv4 TaxID=1945880 RepID=UPI000BD8E673|nr:glucuronyl hydrolase [Nitrosovibrio sp. Nv4]SOD41131.1 unsaturated chondroitin disaccharide hydrolase [Nitrosovibrio sp. Nv4]